jgi:hypothetical protein
MKPLLGDTLTVAELWSQMVQKGHMSQEKGCFVGSYAIDVRVMQN